MHVINQAQEFDGCYQSLFACYFQRWRRACNTARTYWLQVTSQSHSLSLTPAKRKKRLEQQLRGQGCLYSNVYHLLNHKHAGHGHRPRLDHQHLRRRARARPFWQGRHFGQPALRHRGNPGRFCSARGVRGHPFMKGSSEVLGQPSYSSGTLPKKRKNTSPLPLSPQKRSAQPLTILLFWPTLQAPHSSDSSEFKNGFFEETLSFFGPWPFGDQFGDQFGEVGSKERDAG